MVVEVEIGLGDDSVESTVSFQIPCDDGQMILELLSGWKETWMTLCTDKSALVVLFQHRSAVCLEPEDRLDAGL